MPLLDYSISFSSSQQSHHPICIAPWSSPSSLANTSCLHSFPFLWSCLIFRENPSGVLHGIKIGLTWPSDHNIAHHRCIALCLLHLTPLASPLRAKLASHLCLLHGPAKSSGSNFWGIHWVFLPDLASSLQPTLVIPPNSPQNSSLEPPLVHPPHTMFHMEYTSIHWEKPLEQPHSPLEWASCAKFQHGMEIL